MSDNVIRLRPQADLPPVVQPGVTDIALALLRNNEGQGVTWKDLSIVSGHGHGATSGALSRLHKSGQCARLKDRRERCFIYVLPEWVEDRRVSQPAVNTNTRLLDDMAAMLRSIPTKCQHRYWNPRCRSCDIRLLLERYDSR